ncbi:MAG: MBL fold metallo-hydrolase [Promethearchaeota archaeon]|nr:MAG: MBL fold metallo-hydrolase [Candidatus Lokiarchaeota archaeon]
MILGEDKSKFPSGNALFINTEDKKVLIDTNPGEKIISTFLESQFNISLSDITDIILSHAHLDHARGLATVFEASGGSIFGHSDTLKRCEKRVRIGLYAGIPLKEIHHFEAFGESLGFKDRSYPSSKKVALEDKQKIEFNNIAIIAHETNAHCLHMLDYEIIDGDIRILLSCDYDFTPVPWYGVPQRGAAVSSFKSATKQLVERNANYIISSHRIKPINLEKQKEELKQYLELINKRTHRAVNLLNLEDENMLNDMGDFVYPVSKMKEYYSDHYVHCAKNWDKWILLAHLEDAWRLGKVECVDGGNDKFLERCIEERHYLRNQVENLLIQGWAEKTLDEEMPYSLPLNSIWKKI